MFRCHQIAVMHYSILNAYSHFAYRFRLFCVSKYNLNISLTLLNILLSITYITYLTFALRWTLTSPMTCHYMWNCTSFVLNYFMIVNEFRFAITAIHKSDNLIPLSFLRMLNVFNYCLFPHVIRFLNAVMLWDIINIMHRVYLINTYIIFYNVTLI